jgi:hypothetical protein
MLSKTKSIAPMIKAKIMDAISTSTELLCNSPYFGQVTLLRSSSIESVMYFFNLSNFLSFNLFARVERLELPANGFGDHYSTD